MITGSFQPRRIGPHLLVAALGEDCLGTIFRALHATDEKRFVRLRVLQSPELSPPAVFSAIARHGETVAHLAHKAIVQQAELAVADGSPYCAWYEGAGWTLDTILLRLRAAGTALPTPFALLIAERVCAALEHAWFSPQDGEPIRHGLLWPGFVSVSIDAEVRLGGFGLADAVLPSVMRGRLARELAPYVAPETRESGRVGPATDTYSAGVLLLELLTCRRPVVTATRPELRSEDGFSDRVNDLLDRCFAPPEERPSILELHRALQEQLAAGASPVSSADLAYFLYTLLNPESRGVPASDHESTNPVSAEDMAPPEIETAFLGRRGNDPEDCAFTPVFTSEDAEHAPDESSAPEPFAAAAGPPERRPSAPLPRPTARRWASGAAYFAVAAAIILGFEGLAIHRERAAVAAGHPASSDSAARARDAGAPADVSSSAPQAARPRPSASGRAMESVRPARQGVGAPAPAGPSLESPVRPGIVIAGQRAPRADRAPALSPAERSAGTGRPRAATRAADAAAARKAAEDSRFQAAWARIEAERGEAQNLASDAFRAGRGQESEGESLLRSGDHARAREAFERAAASFRQASDHSRQARLERIRLSSPSS
ncbi:MAG: protein kinase [Thermoanaerobaculia bacterium]